MDDQNGNENGINMGTAIHLGVVLDFFYHTAAAAMSQVALVAVETTGNPMLAERLGGLSRESFHAALDQALEAKGHVKSEGALDPNIMADTAKDVAQEIVERSQAATVLMLRASGNASPCDDPNCPNCSGEHEGQSAADAKPGEFGPN